MFTATSWKVSTSQKLICQKEQMKARPWWFSQLPGCFSSSTAVVIVATWMYTRTNICHYCCIWHYLLLCMCATSIGKGVFEHMKKQNGTPSSPALLPAAATVYCLCLHVKPHILARKCNWKTKKIWCPHLLLGKYVIMAFFYFAFSL